jgi:predicted RNA binding protein YcfA (HicA-like mRNA interferase family)
LAGLPVCSGKEAVRAFERLGYEVARQRGSHVRMLCPGRKPLTVPLRKEMKPGTLRALISDSGFSVEEFVQEL